MPQPVVSQPVVQKRHNQAYLLQQSKTLTSIEVLLYSEMLLCFMCC